jgi:hypothetical protein
MPHRSVIVVLVLLAACSRQAPQPVSWYVDHASEREAKVSWCRDDAERQRSADCENALEAKRRLQVGSQKDLPPIDWAASAPKP